MPGQKHASVGAYTSDVLCDSMPLAGDISGRNVP